MKKRLTVFFMMLTLLLSMNTAVFAEDFNVSYEGEAEKFIFLNGSSSIFDSFKNIAPGEVRTQKITLTNNDSQRMRFFMKTTATGELRDADAVFIITISRDGTQLYSGTVQGLLELSSGSMEDSLMLADLSKGETAEVTMTLEVDETLPNEYQNQETDIQFVFAVDNPPVNEGENKTNYVPQDKTVYKQGPTTVKRVIGTATAIASRVKTADPAALGLYAGVLAAGALGILCLLIVRRRKGSKEE